MQFFVEWSAQSAIACIEAASIAHVPIAKNDSCPLQRQAIQLTVTVTIVIKKTEKKIDENYQSQEEREGLRADNRLIYRANQLQVRETCT